MESLMRLYLNACKQIHAIAFFQWRIKFSPDTKSAFINEILKQREEIILANKERKQHYHSLVSEKEGDSSPSRLTLKIKKESTSYDMPDNVNQDEETIKRMKKVKSQLSDNVALQDLDQMENELLNSAG